MGRKSWRGVLQADKGEFEAATGNIALKASAKRYMRAGTELKPGGKV